MRRRWQPLRVAIAMLGVTLVVFGGLQASTAAQAVGTYHQPIEGNGSTWSQNALEAWIRNVWAGYSWKIEYTGNGSTQGRNSFKQGQADFGVTEIPYDLANSNEGDPQPQRAYAYMPIVAGGTAFMYNLRIAGKRVTNLRLSGEVIAKIFTGEITVWNDPAIAADNPALALPAIPIVPVVRSDGSGATAQFSIWMRQEQTAVWDRYCPKVGRPLVNGHCGVTSNYPIAAGSGFIAKAGSNGVAGYVAQSHAEGAITFVEYSYALNARFPVVKMLNNAGYYAEPTASNVAVALLKAQINEDRSSVNYLTQDLTQVYTDSDPRTYPLSSYSYIILPTKLENGFSEDKGLTLADFGAYFLCEGQQSAEVLGYSPLPINLVQAGQEQIQKIPGGDPVIKGVQDCNNPTFTADGSNRLANEAPYPADCDRRGPAQCTGGTGGAKDEATSATSGGNSGSDGGAETEGNTQPVADADADATVADGTVGGAVTVGAAPVVLDATPQQIGPAQPGLLAPLILLAAGVGLFAAAVVPPLLGRRRRKTLLPAPPRGSPTR